MKNSRIYENHHDDSNGAWTVGTTPLVVGFHYYSLVIDGATVADPATRTLFDSFWNYVPAGEFYSSIGRPYGKKKDKRRYTV